MAEDSDATARTRKAIDGPATRPSSGRLLIPVSMVLLIAGAIGIVLFAVGAPDQFAEGSALGALRGGVIIVAGLCFGAGASLGLLALIRRRRRNSADGERPRARSRESDSG